MSVAKVLAPMLASGNFAVPTTTHAVAFSGARMLTRTGSLSRSTRFVAPRGETLALSTTSGPVSDRSGRAGGMLTGTTSRALSVGVCATISYRGADAGGTGRYAMNVPFDATGTGAPLMVSDVCPLPVEPKMKFESRTEIV